MKLLKAAIFILSVVTALVLVNGCNLAPHYTPPTVQTPPAYKETNGWKLAQPSDGVIKGKWWEMFGDPQLNKLEEQVVLSNQNIAAAVQNFFAARDLVKEARAAYYPTVSVDPSVTKTHPASGLSGGSSFGNGAVSTSKSTTSIFQLPGDASWEPDIWDLVRNTVRSQAYAAQASAATLENLKLTEQGDLAIDYFSLRSQDELIQLYTDTIKAYKDSLDLTTTLYETGIDSQLNQAQADALLETTLAQFEALGIQRAQYEHAIALLVGQPASIFSLKPLPSTNQPPMVPLGLPSALLERRPDIAAAERATAQANAQIGVARAAWFPTISLTASAGYESTALSRLISSPDAFFWSIGASAAETVFDGGKRIAADQQAWANYRSAVASYRQTVLTAFEQVEDNLAALRILGSENQQQDIAIRASQKNFDLSLEQYRTGVASYLNVISAQETLLANQQTDVSLRMNQMVNTVQLIMALGGGWDTQDLPSAGKLALKTAANGK
jgi:NodT family efflux transporter outer membrane factor (OMF) lipoprotein